MTANNDCFDLGPELTLAQTALQRLRDSARVMVDKETLSLAEATGRVLAQGLISPRNIPGFDNAALDGYACAAADLADFGETRLPVSDYIAAGRTTDKPLAAGTAVRIFTGAKLPLGADTVIMQEDVRVEDDLVILPQNIKCGANCRAAGEDVALGQELLPAGHRLRAQDIGMAAAMGIPRLTVFKPLRVAVFSTGDEIREPGEVLSEDGVYDVNRYMLHALLRSMGALVTDMGILADDARTVEKALTEAAATHQVVITSGGASTGDADHIARILEKQGKISFWRLAIKPGKPLAFGSLGDARFIGMPGNPVAVVICFLRFAYPLLASLGGQSWPEPQYFELPAAFNLTKKPGRREWLRVYTRTNEQCQLEVVKHARQGSGVLSSLVEADGLVELAEDLTQVSVGDAVRFMPFSQFSL